MRVPIVLLLALVLSSLTGVIHAQDYTIRGNLRSWVRGFIEDPNEIDMTQTRLQLEILSGVGENAAFMASSYLTHDSRLSNQLRWDLKQAYIDYYTPWLTLRMGRQIISWGRADEINPTDILNPQDMSNFLEDKIARKKGLFAVRAGWLFNGFVLQTIWKPEYLSLIHI